MLPERWQGVNRVLVVQTGNAVSVLLAGPVLRALREALPGADLCLLTSPDGSQAASLLPWVNDTLVLVPVWDAETDPPDPRAELEVIQKLRSRSFDAAVILPDGDRSGYPAAYACYLAGIPIRVGQAQEFGGGVFSHPIRPQDEVRHPAERNLFLLESAGFRVSCRGLEVWVPPAVQTAVDRGLGLYGNGSGAPFLYMALKAREPRDWSAYLKVVASAVQRASGMYLVIGGRGRGLVVQRLNSRHLDRLLVRDLGPSWPELGAIIRRAGVVVTDDLGTLLLADALRRPLLVITPGASLGPEWEPRHSPSRLVPFVAEGNPGADSIPPLVEQAISLLTEVTAMPVPFFGSCEHGHTAWRKGE